MKKRRNQVIAGCMALVMGLTTVISPVTTAQTNAAETTAGNTLQNPVIEADKGQVVWDCIYFGNYWQSSYVTQPDNRPTEGEDDVVHTDTDGTKYIVREDKNCYRYDPIKWRVLSVSEDGTEAFLISDKGLDKQQFHSDYSETVTWENSGIRTWLNQDFMNTAFTPEEQEAIIATEVENKKYPGAEEDVINGDNTTDKLYLPSVDEITSRAYGFTDSFDNTDTRVSHINPDFVESGGSIKETFYGSFGFFLRTLGRKKGYVGVTGCGVASGNVHDGDKVDSVELVRPVMHLDLTKTALWTYAGQVQQDLTEIKPGTTPVVPTPSPTPQPGVTMSPTQIYPKNPVIHEEDLGKNTWDCIYLGKYYNTKFTPSVLSKAGEHDTMKNDGEGNSYLTRHMEGYFYYEPIKWRVLSINEDGTDAFLMAEQALDVQAFYSIRDVEITWEKSDIRSWLNTEFMDRAFTEKEKGIIRDTVVKTEDNKWSGEPGGNDTTDKLYLLSIEEALDPSYGFSTDETEGDTRKNVATDYAVAEEKLDWMYRDASLYWLRSPGARAGYPAVVGHWGDGEVLKEASAPSVNGIGVRPVLHVDLSNTSLWSYAGQVTPKGVVVPSKDDSSKDDSSKDDSSKDDSSKDSQNTTKPKTTPKPVKKPGKPTIKTLKNKSGKKVTLKLKKKVSGATGYQVAYATKSSMKGQKKKTFKGTSITIKKLKKKKTYYFRVRAYTKKNGKTVYGDWGKKKKIKIKK
ncbi:MAG: fibronectin type III domain-containing protein [Lachnospiraceae bacterium]|nr:fibronectin type III domain-containing protein [Lachnospiraceae bacterium]